MQRPTLVLILCLLAGLLAWWKLRSPRLVEKETPQPPHFPEQATHATTNIPIATAQPAPLSEALSKQPLDEKSANPSLKRAYMLSLDQGKLTFLEAQDITGDFAPKRGRQEVWSNMLRCRLVSKNNAILAEELLPAPDQVCQVLDPRSTDGNAVNFTNPGPAVFQVRLPRVKDAHRLEIFRIQNPGPPVIETLLDSLTLPPP